MAVFVAAAGFVPVELAVTIFVEAAVFSVRRQSTMIPMMRIVMIIHISVETAWTVEPWTGSDEDSAAKPLWPVVAIGSASIRGIVEIAVGADGCCTNGDGDLGFCRRSGEEGKPNDNSEYCKIFHDTHLFHLV
jgi:hypothetical protein